MKGGNVTVQSVDRSLPADREFAHRGAGGSWNLGDRPTPVAPVAINGAHPNADDSGLLGDGSPIVTWLASADAFLALLATHPDNEK
jgi:hypothetical protein